MMKMKRMTWLLAAFAGLLATSCSNDVPVPGTESNDVITFTVNPDLNVKTRAVPPPSMVPAGKKLRYIMEVYNVEGTTMTLNSRTVKVVADETTPATFTWQRPTGSTYKAVFWADLTLQASEEADAYYDTSSGLNNITFVSSNTDNFDGEAFFGHIDISSETATAESVTLTHAVSLVTLNTTQQLTGFGSVKVSYGEAGNANAPVSSFNAVNGTAGTTRATIEKVNTVSPTEMTGPSSPYNFHNFYLFAPTDTRGLINMKVTMCSDAAGAVPQQSADIPNVPLRANYKTNITGDFAQAKDEFSISCSDSWGGQLRTASVWDGTVPTGNTGGSAFSGGTGVDAANAYIIGCAADLAQLAADVNAGCTYENKYFRLTVDIDLNNKEWIPIGSDANRYKGMLFDGGFHTISNLKINNGSLKEVGLFGYVYYVSSTYASDNKIEKLHVQGNVTSTYSINDDCFAGGICGKLRGWIHSCSFSGTVSNPNGCAGGLVGGDDSSCSNICASKNTATVNGKYVGGIIGNPPGNMIACYNIGTVHGTDQAGGLLTTAYGSMYSAKGSYNVGAISCDNTAQCGGIMAVNNEDIAQDCFVKQSYSTVSSGEKVFGTNTGNWPDGSNSSSDWYANPSNDGSEHKYWKSIGVYDAINPVYPKLWWEE